MVEQLRGDLIPPFVRSLIELRNMPDTEEVERATLICWFVVFTSLFFAVLGAIRMGVAELFPPSWLTPMMFAIIGLTYPSLIALHLIIKATKMKTVE